MKSPRMQMLVATLPCAGAAWRRRNGQRKDRAPHDRRRNSILRAPDPPTAGAAKEPAIALGVLCGIGAALGWAVGFVAVKRGLHAGLTPADIAFHRFVWAGLVLTPAIVRAGVADLGGVGWGRGLVIFLLAGPVQAVISYTGFVVAPLAHGAVIHPGSAALFGFMLAAFWLKEPLTRRHFIAVLIMVAGLLIFAGEAITSIGGHALGGDLLFMTAGLFWATFGTLLKQWRLDGMRAAIVSCVLSLVLFAPAHGLIYGYGTMLAAGWTENLLQVAVQGLFAGGLAIYLYSRAVAILGAGRAAVFPSLVPASTVAIGFLALGEVPTAWQLAGLTVVMLGFWLALRR
jgi:drug/metabolite transporter (DMT)-like permease